MNNAQIEEIVAEVMQRLQLKTKQDLLVYTRDIERVADKLKLLEDHWHVILFQGEIPPTTKHAIFLDVDQDLLVKGALGITDTEVTMLFSKLMIQDFQITFVPTDYLWNILSNEQRKSYPKQLLKYKEKLQDYGVTICSLIDVVSNSFPMNSRNLFEGKLVTEKDIDSWVSDRMYVEQGTVITPLAMDAAKQKGIIIEKLVPEKGNR